MLRFHNYDIVFAEIPNEVSLAVNITACPNRCKGCHSLWLWKDEGHILDEEAISTLIGEYSDITCFCFMGGDNDPKQVNDLARFVKNKFGKKTAWYSGKNSIDKNIDVRNFDFIKIGAYIQELGPLKERTTNQRLYSVKTDGDLEDITHLFWKK
ncbi:MAG: anaerobic ribonucleoside-triphosphate reductase activating protein [Bacteroidales bacterium]|nr:anaerobic ribonucleoside-triphosphate reductase activating protein [Bacteroidales bacterium]